MEDIREVLKFGEDLGNTFLLVGLVTAAVWLQSISQGVAPMFLIIGGMIVMYTKWQKGRLLKEK